MEYSKNTNFLGEAAQLIFDLATAGKLSRREYEALPVEQKWEILRGVFEELKKSEALSNSDNLNLDHEKIATLREELKIAKWLPLSHLVAFTRTLIGEMDQEDRKQLYEKFIQDKFDLDLISRFLTVKNDVKPSNIKRDIQRQSSQFYRAFVELASNAYDACLPMDQQVGRFGMGFFQSINHLRDADSRLLVKTRSHASDHTNSIQFSYQVDDYCLRVLEESLESNGTLVELKASHINQELVKQIILDSVAHTQGVKFIFNGEILNSWTAENSKNLLTDEPIIEITCYDGYFSIRDYGRGITCFDNFESLLTPKLSSKPPVYKLQNAPSRSEVWYELNQELEDDSKCEFIVQVGGFTIEKHEFFGFNMCKTLVFNLPNYTFLTEERNRIEINDLALKNIRGLIVKSLELEPSARTQMVNVLTKACQIFQERNIVDGHENHLPRFLQDQAIPLYFNQLVYPNESNYLNLANADQGASFLDRKILCPDYYNNEALTYLGLINGVTFFLGDFKASSSISYIQDDTTFIFDRRVLNSSAIELVNKAVSQALGFEIPCDFLRTDLIVDDNQILRLPLVQLAELKWKEWGFPNLAAAQLICATLIEQNQDIYQMISDKVDRFLSTNTFRFIWASLSEVTLRPMNCKDLSFLENSLKALESILANNITANLVKRKNLSVLSAFVPMAAYVPAHLLNKIQQAYTDQHGDQYYLIKRDNGRRFVISAEGIYVDSPSEMLSDLNEHHYSYQDVTENLFPIIDRSVTNTAPCRLEAYDKLERKFICSNRTLRITDATELDLSEVLASFKFEQDSAQHLFQLNDNSIRIVSGEMPENDDSSENSLLGITAALFDENANVLWSYQQSNLAAHGINDGMAACRVIDSSNTIHGEAALIEIFAYVSEKKEEKRIVVGYVNAEGEEVSVSEKSTTNSVILFSRYSYELADSWEGYKTPLLPSNQKDFVLQTRPVYDAHTNSYKALASWRAWLNNDDQVTIGVVVFNSKGELTKKEPIYQGVCEDVEGFLKEHITANKCINPFAEWGSVRESLRNILIEQLQITSNASEKELASVKIIIRDSLLKPQIFNSRESQVEHYLDVANTELSKSDLIKLKVLSDKLANFFIKNPHLDNFKLTRLFVRIINSAALSESQLSALIPVFYEIDDLSPNILKKEVITHLDSILNLSPERLVSFFQLINHCMPKELELASSMMKKAVSFFNQNLRDKPISDTEKIISSLKTIVDYADQQVYCDGYTLIRNNIKIPIYKIDINLVKFYMCLDLRPENYVDLQRPEITLPLNKPTKIMLSKLIHWKRTRESEAKTFDGSAELVKKLVSQATHRKSHEHIKREITHAIHHINNSDDSNFYREMLQNSFDEIVKSKAENPEDRTINVSIHINSDSQYSVTFEDRVGMSTMELFNFLLIIDESGKIEGESLGSLGKGFYSILREQAIVKTSDGSGKTWYVKFTPQLDNGMVIDHELSIWSIAENYKGTATVKFRKTNDLVAAVSMSRDVLNEMASLIDANQVRIIANGQLVNTTQECIYRHKIPGLGYMSIYKHPANIITRGGIRVRKISENDLSPLPISLRKIILSEVGIVIDLPAKIPLTNSGDDIACKDLYIDQYNSVLAQGLIISLVNSLKQLVKKDLSWFPFDFFTKEYFSRPKVELPDFVTEDLTAIMTGHQLNNYEKYLDKINLYLLMSELPLFEIEGTIHSLNEVKDLANADQLKVALIWRQPGQLREILSDIYRAHRFVEALSKLEPFMKKTEQQEVKTIFSPPLDWHFNFKTGREQIDLKLLKFWTELNLLKALNDLFVEEFVNLKFCRSDIIVQLFYDNFSYEQLQIPRLGCMFWNLNSFLSGKQVSLTKKILELANTAEQIPEALVEALYSELSSSFIRAVIDLNLPSDSRIYKSHAAQIEVSLLANGVYEKLKHILANQSKFSEGQNQQKLL